MTEHRTGPALIPTEPELPVPAGDPEAWKTVYMGQLTQDLVPFHPEPPEAPEDELTRAAMEDPIDVTREDAHGESAPTLWRLITVIMIAVAALAVVFWRH
jgi:hypothetical protein